MKNVSMLGVAKSLVLTLVASALLAGCGGGGGTGAGLYGGGNPPAPQPSSSPAIGALNTATLKGSPGFINNAGHTVYVFDADLANPGQSNCNGACAQNWPPVLVSASTVLPTNWGMITRQDSTHQLTYKGRPLYLFAFDINAGDTNGDGQNAFGGLWHIARP